MNPEEDLSDLKINLSKESLIELIGQKAFSELESLFEQRYDEIVIRRCESHGKFINFHTDVSKRTMQLSLNGDDEYQGGRLLYLINNGFYCPTRSAGTITIHHNDIVHGVTLFESGVRYGLFFLYK